MEIKTIKREHPDYFDHEVNAALADGWHLTKRELIPTPANYYDYFYAELVKLDPPVEPEKPDPLEALRIVRDFCLGIPQEDCVAGRCPLFGWCTQVIDGKDPSAWELPDEEATA